MMVVGRVSQSPLLPSNQDEMELLLKLSRGGRRKNLLLFVLAHSQSLLSFPSCPS